MPAIHYQPIIYVHCLRIRDLLGVSGLFKFHCLSITTSEQRDTSSPDNLEWLSRLPLPAAAAEGFKDAIAYDSHRPSYPPEAVESLLRHLRIADTPNLNVVEIASGTGKFTELLAERHEGYNILAVEPHQGMREQLMTKATRRGESRGRPVREAPQGYKLCRHRVEGLTCEQR